LLLRRTVPATIVVLGLCLMENTARAGMPSPQLIVTELGKRRLEEVSFFLFGFLLVTEFCRRLWNGLAKEIRSLPTLGYRNALCIMFLWGLALTVVLSLVSGARELMTPAAWEPNGITHRLAASHSNAASEELAKRRLKFESLKTELWKYAANHDSRFPSDVTQLPAEIAVADPISGLPYFLQPDLTTSSPATVLAREPDIYRDRLLLLTDGTIVGEVSREGRSR
jgi:hypothetical protein